MSGRPHWSLRPPVTILGYTLVRVLAMVAQAFPFEASPVLGRWLGRLLKLVNRRLRTIGRRNLERAGIADAGRTLDRVYDHVGRSLVEVLMAPRLAAARAIPKIVRLDRFDLLDRALEAGRGAIVAIGHTGNYELIGLAVALAGYPLASVARPIVNPMVDAYLGRLRKVTGQRIIPREKALSEMIRTLRGNGVLVIQIDLDAKKTGALVDFFGRPASTERSPAMLALRYGAPLILADIYVERGRHHAVLHPPFEAVGPPTHEAVDRLTAAMTRRFEGFVRARPEQWLWLLDRWRGAEKRLAATAGAPAP